MGHRKQIGVDECGAVCLAWADCGDKEFTHGCTLPADHEGGHKFPCVSLTEQAAFQRGQQAMASTDIGRLQAFREGTGASAEGVAANPNLDDGVRALAREYLAIRQAMAEKAAQNDGLHAWWLKWHGRRIDHDTWKDLMTALRSLTSAEPPQSYWNYSPKPCRKCGQIHDGADAWCTAAPPQGEAEKEGRT